MKSKLLLNRRQFVKQTLATTLAAALPGDLVSAAAATEKARAWNFCAFGKPLQFLSFDELTEFMAELGVNGVEVAV
jgi:hypothetical protein